MVYKTVLTVLGLIIFALENIASFNMRGDENRYVGRELKACKLKQSRSRRTPHLAD